MRRLTTSLLSLSLLLGACDDQGSCDEPLVIVLDGTEETGTGSAPAVGDEDSSGGASTGEDAPAAYNADEYNEDGFRTFMGAACHGRDASGQRVTIDCPEFSPEECDFSQYTTFICGVGVASTWCYVERNVDDFVDTWRCE